MHWSLKSLSLEMDAWILHYFITMCCSSSKVVMLHHKLERHDSSKALFLLQISKGITNCHYSRVFPLLEKEHSELLNNLSFSFSFMDKIGFFHAEEKKYMPFVYPQENLVRARLLSHTQGKSRHSFSNISRQLAISPECYSSLCLNYELY